MKAQAAADRQTELWTPPKLAAIGETLERLAQWCDAHKHTSFALQRTSMTRALRAGGAEYVRGWAIDVRKRSVSIHTLTASSLDELARVVNDWIDERRDAR